MRIISWNTNGLRATVKQGFFYPLFKDNPDMICFQETKASPDQLNEETKNIQGYTSYFSSSEIKKGYSGVAIYTKEKPLEVFYGLGIKKFDQEGRVIGIKYKDFTLINIYVPNGGMGPERLRFKLDFYDKFLKFILKLRKNGELVIFCGDINTAHKPIDLAHPKENEDNTGFLPIERAWIDKVIENDFIDVFRKFYPDKKDIYTYWDLQTYARDRNVGWRFDCFFADIKLMDKIKDTGLLKDYYGSDHCPVWLEIN